MRRTALDTKRMVTLSALIAVAMILSYVESMIPAFVAVPGVKMGLSNIATVFALYTLGWPYAICVSAVRVVLSALLFGNVVGLIYSLSGAALALLGMILLQRLNSFSSIGVSVAGGVMHNLGQVLVAMLILDTPQIAYYMLVLSVTGILAGIAVGLCGVLVLKRIPPHLLMK